MPNAAPMRAMPDLRFSGLVQSRSANAITSLGRVYLDPERIAIVV